MINNNEPPLVEVAKGKFIKFKVEYHVIGDSDNTGVWNRPQPRYLEDPVEPDHYE